MKSSCPCLAVIVLLAMLMPATALADDAAQSRIEQLERKVATLEARLQKLEQRWDKGVPMNRALKIEPEPGGWRNLENWKLLGQGMPYDEVLRILGEPDNTKTIKKFEHWEYGDGKTRLYLNRLKSWEVPTLPAE